MRLLIFPFPFKEHTSKELCSAVGAHVEVSGGISGIITHCIQEHGLKGDWLCTHCHPLYTSEHRLENHIG